MKQELFKFLAIAATVLLSACSTNSNVDLDKLHPADKVVIAYVTSWSKTMPDPTYLTHINYAFGHVNDTYNGVRIDNEERFRDIVKLRKKYKHVKVILSIGGWGSGNFSEMAADSTNRALFAQDCKRVVDEFKLDGIDIDWEYPTSSMAKISSSENDTENYTLLMRDIRSAIGEDKILSHATASTAKYIDHAAVDQYIDYTNVMSYDLGWAPFHNSPLYQSEIVDEVCVDDAINAHLAAGVPKEKLVMGLAFYGRGIKGFPRGRDLTKVHELEGYTYVWDTLAQVPYLLTSEGEFAFGYENLESLTIKCNYILDRELMGAMFWSYDGDNENGDLRRTVFTTLNPIIEEEE